MGEYSYRNINEIGNKDVLDQANKLRDFLQQKQQFQQNQQQPFKLAEQKAQLGQEEQERNIKSAQDIVDSNAKAGGAVSSKIGDVSIMQREDNPLKYVFSSQQRGAKALSHAYDTYMKAFPEVQKKAQSSEEGLAAVNDPNQINSVGQAKTLMIKNLGMNRYNQQEGNALVAPQFAQVIHEIFNKVGNDQNPLTDIQRKALNSTFQAGLQTARKQHEIAKQNALGSYAQSGFYDPAQGAEFKAKVGADFDKQLNDITEKYKEVPQNPGYQPPPPGSQAPTPEPSFFQKLFGKTQGMANPQRSQTSPTTAPQNPTGTGTDSSTPMSFEEYKRRKAAGTL